MIHKNGRPGRPIVSDVGSPTEGFSELIDYFVQPFIPNIPSYIRYMQDFLDKLHVLCPLPAYASGHIWTHIYMRTPDTSTSTHHNQSVCHGE